MKKLLISGVSGLLGANLALEASRSYKVIGLVHSHILSGTPFEVRAQDLTNLDSIAGMLDEIKSDAVINCAAQTNLDAVEVDPRPAWLLNAEMPGVLASECAARNIQLAQISTDAVFDGVHGSYTEESIPYPINTYGHTKLAGEKAVLTANPAAIVARVVFYGWSPSGKRSLSEWFLSNLMAGQSIQGFKDIFFCPLLANQLSQLLLEMMEQSLSGLYHLVSRDFTSKYQFGVALAAQFKLDSGLITPASYGEVERPASRSPNLILKTEKLTRDLRKPLPDIHSGIEQLYHLHQEGYPGKLIKYMQ